MKNKRGDIPIIVLVIGVFSICALLILSFNASSMSFKENFVVLELVSNVNSMAEESFFYAKVDKVPEETMWQFRDRNLSELNFYSKAEKNFEFEECAFRSVYRKPGMQVRGIAFGGFKEMIVVERTVKC
jgi:hypothetical protein